MDRKYKINTIFYTIQGEGRRVGTPQVFIRFSGCNLKCDFCDTEHESHELLSASEILGTAISVSQGCRSVSFCGGEPTLQLDSELIEKFSGWYKSIETNGTKKVPAGIDWVVCSPKKDKIKPSVIDELRFVIADGDPLPQTTKKAKYKTISPMFDGEEPNKANIDYCIELVKANPSWIMSMQHHKTSFGGID